MILYEQRSQFHSRLHQLVSTLPSSMSMWRHEWGVRCVLFLFILTSCWDFFLNSHFGDGNCDMSRATYSEACHWNPEYTKRVSTFYWTCENHRRKCPSLSYTVSWSQTITQSLREAAFVENLIIFHNEMPETLVIRQENNWHYWRSLNLLGTM